MCEELASALGGLIVRAEHYSAPKSRPHPMSAPPRCIGQCVQENVRTPMSAPPNSAKITNFCFRDRTVYATVTIAEKVCPHGHTPQRESLGKDEHENANCNPPTI